MSVRLLMASVLLLTSPFAAFAQSNSTLSDSALAQQVIDAEDAWANAFQGCNPDALATLTTDDFTFTDYNGMTYSRLWFMNTAEACERKVVRIEPMQITLNDADNSALVLSRYHQFIGDEPVPVHQLSHLLVRQSGTWKVAQHHSTIMSDQLGPSGDQYGLPLGGKAFTQLIGGPSTRTAPAFEPMIFRYTGDPSKNTAADRVSLEKQVMTAIYTYAGTFQNCRTAHMEEVLSDGYLLSGFNGMTYTRDYMVAVSDGCYHDLQRIEPLQLRLYGDNTAVLLSRYHQFVRNNATDLRHLTVVAFREEGTWRVSFHYSTTFNENVGSSEGKLFYSEGGFSTLNGIPLPNWVAPPSASR